MGSDEITVRVLKEIRDAVAQTNAQLDQTNAELRETRDELGRRIVESEMRTATAIADLAGAVNGLADLLRDQLELRDRVGRCEADIRELKRRVS